MKDEKSVLESLSAAATSSDLSHRPTRCDVDWEHALGKAGSRLPTGMALLYLDLTLSSVDVPRAMRATMELVGEIAATRGWPLHSLKRRKIAEAALTHFVTPACPACKGRGMVGVDRDKPAEYKPRPCPKCEGSGVRSLRHKYGREVREVLRVMTARRYEVARMVRRIMATRAPVE